MALIEPSILTFEFVFRLAVNFPTRIPRAPITGHQHFRIPSQSTPTNIFISNSGEFQYDVSHLLLKFSRNSAEYGSPNISLQMYFSFNVSNLIVSYFLFASRKTSIEEQFSCRILINVQIQNRYFNTLYWNNCIQIVHIWIQKWINVVWNFHFNEQRVLNIVEAIWNHLTEAW